MRSFLSFVLFLTVGFACMAEAHPHVFADVTVKAVFDQNGFTGVQNQWAFDEVFLGPLEQNNYYNYVQFGTKFLRAEKIENFSVKMKNGKMVLDFKVAFSVPATSDYTMLVVVVSDITNYIQMTTDMENADVDAPDAMDVEFFPDNLKGLTLFRAFMSDTEGLFLRFKK